jgi:transcriptional regulator with XRE-family HTH domain
LLELLGLEYAPSVSTARSRPDLTVDFARRPLPPDTPTLGEALSRRYRDRRKAAKLSQDDVAQRMRALGYPWTRSIVGAVEADPPRRGVDLSELLALLASVGTSLEETLSGIEEPVLLSPGVVEEDDRNVAGSGRFVLAVIRGRIDLVELVAGTDALVSTVEDERSRDAEVKAAKTLDVAVETVVQAARRLWGRGLTEERDARVRAASDSDVSARSLQAIRGHVTRALMTELAPKVEAIERRRRKSKPKTTTKRGKR